MFGVFSTIVFLSFGGLVVFGIVLLVVIAYFTRPRYVKNQLMTAAERQFYHILRQVVGGQYDIFSQVRLASLVTLESKSFLWEHFHPLGAKCVDFVLYDRATGGTILIIELDDSTHLSKHRQKRDRFVDLVFERAAFPILHYQRQSQYKSADLKKAIHGKFAYQKLDSSTALEP